MASRLEKLLFSVSLIDKASGPAGKIAAQIDQLNQRATAGFTQVGVGAAGLFATGYALKSVLSPAIEMDRALGEVRSLGVADAALKQLEKTSLSFSVQYGESAAEFVRSSYDIQSAIAGLTGTELSKFTEAGAVLAKGTKSDVGTITNYMGTMYGIFQATADKMGKAEWVQMLAGQTASAVQMFKTTGSEMSSAFSSLGADATAAGISMSEQMAILGTLQATMSGSEAGTKYRAFLKGVGKAQDELGLTFTDSQGRMLPMLDILQKLRGRFGDTIDVAESMQLQKAFGTQEAVALLNLLIPKADGLKDSMDALGNVRGMDKAREMADAMADPWQKLGALGAAVKTVFGRVMQPVLVPVIDLLISGGEAVMDWTERFPMLTKVIGVGILTIFGLVAAVSAFALIQGVANLAMAGWSGAMLAGKAATMLFNAALWANPITWVVGGIMLLIGAIVALVVYWDRIVAALDNSIVFQILRLQVQAVVAVLGLFWDAIVMIYDAWKYLMDLLGFTAVFNLIKQSLFAIGEQVAALIGRLTKFTDAIAQALKAVADNGLVNTLASWFGDEEVSVTQKIQQERDAMDSATAGLQANKPSAVPTGGLMQQVNQSTTNNRGTHVDKIEVHTSGGVSGYQLADELALAGG